MDFILKPFKGISDDLLFGISRPLVNKKIIDLGLKPDKEGGGDREYIEELGLIIHYSKNGIVEGFEFFMNNEIPVSLSYRNVDLYSLDYENLYQFITKEDFFVVRFNEDFISLGLGVVVGYNPEKPRCIDSIFIMADKEAYKKIILDEIESFY